MNLNTDLKILTPYGFESFSGVICNGIKQTIKIYFDDNSDIVVTPDHRLFTQGQEIQAKYLLPKMLVDGKPSKRVTKVILWDKLPVYDVLNVPSHVFYYNGILSHNCEFISDDPLLFDTRVLASLTAYVRTLKPYATVNDIVLHEEIKHNGVYLVGMDPATGTGSDYTTITAFNFPSMTQTLSWRSNVMSSTRAYQVLKRILNMFVKHHCTVYFSVENNSVGEGIITAFELDEDPIDVNFISEEGSKRLGMTTTSRTKMKACVTAKDLVERGSITIKSPILIEEMKNYVRRAKGYGAKIGATDDMISALLIVIRILEQVASYDQIAFDKLYAHAYDSLGQTVVDYEDNYQPDGFVF